MLWTKWIVFWTVVGSTIRQMDWWYHSSKHWYKRWLSVWNKLYGFFQGIDNFLFQSLLEKSGLRSFVAFCRKCKKSASTRWTFCMCIRKVLFSFFPCLSSNRFSFSCQYWYDMTSVVVVALTRLHHQVHYRLLLVLVNCWRRCRWPLELWYCFCASNLIIRTHVVDLRDHKNMHVCSTQQVVELSQYQALSSMALWSRRKIVVFNYHSDKVLKIYTRSGRISLMRINPDALREKMWTSQQFTLKIVTSWNLFATKPFTTNV